MENKIKLIKICLAGKPFSSHGQAARLTQFQLPLPPSSLSLADPFGSEAVLIK